MNKDSRVTVALLFYTQERSHCSAQWGYRFVFVWMCLQNGQRPHWDLQEGLGDVGGG